MKPIRACLKLSAFQRPLLGVGLLAALAAGSARSEIVLEGLKAIQQLENASGARKVVPKPKDAEPLDKTEVQDPAYAHTLRFLNGDLLRGNLISIDAQKGVRWRSPEARADIEFSTAKLAKILLPRTAKAANEGGACLVQLTNGDELTGNVVLLDDTKLVLETSYAGRMSFPRKRVQSLRLVKAASAAIFEGPTGMEGWTSRTGRNSWRYSNNGFTAQRPGNIGRDIKLPAMARLEMDLSWRGQLQFFLSIYTDGFEEYGNNSYMLQINSGYVYLQRVRRNSGSQHLGQAEVPGLHQRAKAHLEILVNKEARTIALLVDGVLVKQWKENMEWVGSGSGVLFGNQGMGYIRVANVLLTEWDGKIEDRSGAGGKSKTDVAELSNKDKISGTLESIKDGQMTFATAFAKMDIPLDRVQAIEFSGENAVVAEKNPADVRVIFAGRGQLTLALEKWDGQQLLGTSSNFGQVKFNAGAFNQIVFNYDQQKKDSPLEMFGSDEGEIEEQ